MPRKLFEKGNKLAKGGLRNPPGGRPTDEQRAEKSALIRAIQRKRDKRADRLADKYLDMAEEDPATMRHLVDKDWAAAKQEVEHSGNVIVHVKSTLDWDKV